MNGLSVKMEQGKPETVYWNPNTRLAATARVITRITWGIDVLVSRRYRPAGAGGHAPGIFWLAAGRGGGAVRQAR